MTHKIIIPNTTDYPYIRHPEGLFCPICGCGEIYYWPEIDDWDKLTEEQKFELENCPCCGYGTKEFPYEDFE